MIEAAQSPELKSALLQQLEESLDHVRRLERAFAIAGTSSSTKSNSILKEMTIAATDSASNIDDPVLRDAALTVNGNFIEHYEIALYGSLVEFARALGLNEIIAVLEETVEEEKAADAKLSNIGKSILSKARRRAA